LLFACFENDLKRLLAFSTVSQVGFILAAPYAGAFYALCHGITKASLFLCCGNLPTYKLQILNQKGVSTPCFVILLLGGFSLVGLPMFGTFSAKASMLETLYPWQQPLILAASIGTAVYAARFSFIRPRRDKKTAVNLLIPSYMLIGCALVIGLITSSFSPMVWLKSLVVAIIGWTVGLLMLRYVSVNLPTRLERFQDLLGFTGAMLLVMILVVRA
jgi:multicomponent Na+:H+ antiporter subunit D